MDVTIIKNKDYLEFDWYHKPTFSGCYLNFLSARPTSQKKGVFEWLIKLFYYLNQNFIKKNIRLVINIIIRNDYPMEIIFDTISTRLKFLSSKRVLVEQDSMSNNDNSENIKRIPWFLISYTNTTSDF